MTGDNDRNTTAERLTEAAANANRLADAIGHAHENPPLSVRAKVRVRQAANAAAGGLGLIRDVAVAAARAIGGKLTSRRAVRISVALAAVTLVVAIEYALLSHAGVLGAILYTFLFVVGLAGVPALVLLFGGAFVGGVGAFFGGLHWIFAAAAAGGHYYLVWDEDGPGLWPGEADRVWIDGDWHAIDGGLENRTILGWQPFGVIWADKDSLQAARIDAEAMADGGAAEKRGGFEAKAPPRPRRDEWVVDLGAWFGRGIQRIGDIEVLEKAEEVTQREEHQDATLAGWQPIIATTIGLVLGVGTAVMLT